MPGISVPVPETATAGTKPKLTFAEMFRTADGRSHIFTFALVTILFGLWGFSNGQLEVLNVKFQDALNMSIRQSTLVQFVTFIGYGLMAIPAGKLARRFGYKGGILIGLGLVAVGAFWFIPATRIATFPAFLAGLFLIACGLACLETVANPYTTVLGPAEGAAARINLAQSCNGLGVMLGPIVGGSFVLSATEHSDKSLANLYIPYLLIGVVVTVLGIMFALSKVPDIVDTSTEVKAGASLMKKPHLVAAVLTQFCYVGAQIALWALFINYIRAEAPGMSVGVGTAFPEGWTFERAGSWYFTDRGASRLLSGAFLCFLLGRISGSMALRSFSAHRTLAIYGAINAILMTMVVLRLGWISVFALFAANFFMSIMFPTIFSLGIHGLGEETKRASSYIVMAIAGGAVFPFLNGWISDKSMALGFIVPLICFGVVAMYGFNWEKLARKSGVLR
jgi:MFS transporter, FHS family, L-fucose permease